MKRIIYLILLSLVTIHCIGQEDVRATAKVSGQKIQAWVKPTTTQVTFPNSGSNNVVQLIVVFSLPANGALDASLAPAPVGASSSTFPTLSFASYSTFLMYDRYVYTYYNNPTGVATQAAWPVNQEKLFMELEFPVGTNMTGARLENYWNSGGGPNFFDYFYFELNSAQRSDSGGTPFYDGIMGTYPPWGDQYVQAPSALPITLIAFNAQKFQDRSTHLTWTTSTEVNGSHFNIQRSFDNKSWSNVGKVNAVGNSQIIQNYEFMDANVYNGTDTRLTAYYRLQAVDLDGTSKTSLIKSVVFTSTGSDVGREFAVYPNPSSEGVYITWDNSGEQPANLEFFDINGKLAYTRKVADNSTQEYINFSETTIIPGLYIVRILGKTEVLDTKQIIVDKR